MLITLLSAAFAATPTLTVRPGEVCLKDERGLKCYESNGDQRQLAWDTPAARMMSVGCDTGGEVAELIHQWRNLRMWGWGTIWVYGAGVVPWSVGYFKAREAERLYDVCQRDHSTLANGEALTPPPVAATAPPTSATTPPAAATSADATQAVTATPVDPSVVPATVNAAPAPALKHGTVSLSPSGSKIGDFLVIRLKDQMTDADIFAVGTSAVSGPIGVARQVPLLVVGCADTKLTASIRLGSPLAVDAGAERVDVLVRFDEETASTEAFLRSDDLQSLVPLAPAVFADELSAHDGGRLRARVTLFPSSTLVVEFPLNGAAVAVSQVRGACGL